MDNLAAFLTMLGWSEGTITVAGSDNGYNVLVGGTIFTSYADHPRKIVNLGSGLYSTAAGRYQIREAIFDGYKTQLRLPDFSPASQDAIAEQLIKECGAISDVYNGDIEDAIAACSSRWASLPGAKYGQRVNALADLKVAFFNGGGTIA